MSNAFKIWIIFVYAVYLSGSPNSEHNSVLKIQASRIFPQRKSSTDFYLQLYSREHLSKTSPEATTHHHTEHNNLEEFWVSEERKQENTWRKLTQWWEVHALDMTGISLYTVGHFRAETSRACLLSAPPTVNPIPIIYVVHSPFRWAPHSVVSWSHLSLIIGLWLLVEILENIITNPLEPINLCLLPAWHCTKGLRGGIQKKNLYQRPYLLTEKQKTHTGFGINLMP